MEPKESFQKFRDDNFLAYNTLNDKLVLEYFYLSQFYDASSLNQRRRRGLQVSNTAEGVEFRVIFRNSAGRGQIQAPAGSQWNFPNQFGVFVIQKFNRDSKGTETPLECYYVIGGTIFKSPSLGDLIRQRILGGVKHLESLLTNLSSISSWSLIEGYSWGNPSSLDETDEFLPATDINQEKLDHEMIEGDGSVENDQTSPLMQQDFEMIVDDERISSKRRSEWGNAEFDARWVAVEDLYTKRQCTDASRMIEETFAALAHASIKFNSTYDEVREAWRKSDQDWQDEQLQTLQ